MFYSSNPWTCMPCIKTRAKERYAEKRSDCMAASKVWAQSNRERSRQIKQDYRERNRAVEREYHRYRREYQPEKVKEVQDRYRIGHTAIYSEASANRRSVELLALPSWADRDKIKALYTEAALQTMITGEPYEVDHIIPLQGDTVCGLHVYDNLRVIHRHDNRVKSNILEESSDE